MSIYTVFNVLRVFSYVVGTFLPKVDASVDNWQSEYSTFFSFTRSIAENITDDTDDQPKIDKLSLKKKGIGSEARAERVANANVDLQLLNETERGRQLQKQKKRRLQGREDDVC